MTITTRVLPGRRLFVAAARPRVAAERARLHTAEIARCQGIATAVSVQPQ